MARTIQIGTHPDVLASYPARVQTRREQVAELMRRHGFSAFGRAAAARFLSWLTPIAQVNRKPGHLVGILVEEVRWLREFRRCSREPDTQSTFVS